MTNFQLLADRIFPNREPDEKISLFIRRHWIVLARHVAKLGITLLLPVGALVIALNTPIQAELVTGSVIYVATVLGLSIYYLSIVLFFYHDWLDYHLDLWIVTNFRIVNIEQNSLFSRVVSEQDISRVQDVTAEIQGKLATFLNFGNVTIQTAGEQRRFVFEQVANPQEVAKEILRIHREVEALRRHQLDDPRAHQDPDVHSLEHVKEKLSQQHSGEDEGKKGVDFLD